MRQNLLLFPLMITPGIAGLSAQNCVDLRTNDGMIKSIKPVIIYAGRNNTVTYDIYLDQNPDPNTFVGTSLSRLKFQLNSPLAPNQLYYYKITGKDSSGNEVCTSETRSINTIAPPDNDEPENAVPLTIDANPIPGTTFGSTPTITSSSAEPGDVFYSFIADGTDIRILPSTHNLYGSSIISSKVYRSNSDGSLGTLMYTTYTLLNGQVTIDNEQTPVTGGLTVGERYYVSINEYIDNDYTGRDFDIQLKNIQYAPMCSDVILKYDTDNNNYYALLDYNEYLSRASSYRLYLSSDPNQLIQPANLVNTYIPDWAHYDTTYNENYRTKIPFPASLENGTYYWAVVGVNSVGTQIMCNGVKTFTVPDVLAVTEAQSNQNTLVKVHPNPVDNVLYISMKNISENVELTILDTAGRIIRSQKIDRPSGTDPEISLNGLASGTYLLNLKGNNTHYSTKFIKK